MRAISFIVAGLAILSGCMPVLQERRPPIYIYRRGTSVSDLMSTFGNPTRSGTAPNGHLLLVYQWEWVKDPRDERLTAAIYSCNVTIEVEPSTLQAVRTSVDGSCLETTSIDLERPAP